MDEAFKNAPRKCAMGWSVVPEALRASPYSPILNNPHTLGTYGGSECFSAASKLRAGERGGCIPAYRPGLM